MRSQASGSLFPCPSMSRDGELSQAQAAVVGRDSAVTVNLKVLAPQAGTHLMRKKHVEKNAAAQHYSSQTRRLPEPATYGTDDFHERRMEAPSNASGIRTFDCVLGDAAHKRARVHYQRIYM